MPIVLAKCTECGGTIKVDSDKKLGVCENCGEPFVVEDAINNFTNYYETNYITNNNTTHNYSDGTVVNVYEDKNKDFVIEAGVLKEYHGESQDVIVPDNVTVIGEKCFEGLNIKNIFMSENIVSIESKAFHNCKNLSVIKFPKNLTNIGSEAFCGCNNLTEIVISDKLEHIGICAFSYCNLKKTNYLGTIDQWVELSFGDIASNPTYFSGDLYINDELLINANLENISRIGNYSFCNCKNLKYVSLPETLITIGAYAFYGCTKLKNMIIPNSVKNMGRGIFVKCNLTSLSMPIAISSLGNSEFKLSDYFQYKSEHFCNGSISQSLENIKITGGNEIPPRFFLDAQNVKSILLHNGITKIGAMAFSGCENLENINLPYSLKILGDNAFEKCKNLTYIALPPELEEIGSHVFKDCNYLINIDIPEKVSKKIQNDAQNNPRGIYRCFPSYWKKYNRCANCGGEFSLFNKCKNCGEKKDY